METISVLLALCAGNSPVTGEFPTQRPVTRSFDVYFDLCVNKRLSKQSWGWWFETASHPLWRHCNGIQQHPLCRAIFYFVPEKHDFSLGDWKDIFIAQVDIIIKSEVSALPIVIIFFRGCVPDMSVTSYSVTYCIYIPGKPGFCFHYYCAVDDEFK